MRCPYCQADSHVVDTRDAHAGVRRRRQCQACERRFTTYERLASANLQVVKSDGRRESFDREKLLRGLRLATVKRPIAADTLESIATDIESRLYALGRNEVPSATIGEMVMDHLRDIDDVAYVRFASVYRHFTDLEVLSDEIDQLRETKRLEAQRKRQIALEL